MGQTPSTEAAVQTPHPALETWGRRQLPRGHPWEAEQMPPAAPSSSLRIEWCPFGHMALPRWPDRRSHTGRGTVPRRETKRGHLGTQRRDGGKTVAQSSIPGQPGPAPCRAKLQFRQRRGRRLPEPNATEQAAELREKPAAPLTRPLVSARWPLSARVTDHLPRRLSAAAPAHGNMTGRRRPGAAESLLCGGSSLAPDAPRGSWPHSSDSHPQPLRL